MANSIQQSERGADKGIYGKLRRAQNNEFVDLAHNFCDGSLGRSPDFVVHALTENSTDFPIWDGRDPLANSNADVNGVASPAMTFPASSLTPVRALVAVADDNEQAIIGVEAMVNCASDGENLTLVPAYPTIYSITATLSASGTTATRVAATSDVGTSVLSAGTAFQFTYGNLVGATLLAAHLAATGSTVAVTDGIVLIAGGPGVSSTTVNLVPIDSCGGASVVAPDDGVLYASVRGMARNREFLRNTQNQTDLVDTEVFFDINETTPDSLELNVAGTGTAELRWIARIWIGEPLSVAARTQA